MRGLYFIFFFSLVIPFGSVHGQKRPILVTGFWSPTNELARKWNSRSVNGYPIVGIGPQYRDARDGVGYGKFRVDFAAVFNDFFDEVETLAPIAIVSLGKGGGLWEIETNQNNYPNRWLKMDGGIIGIASMIGIPTTRAVPSAFIDSKKTASSTLPHLRIAKSVNEAVGAPIAIIDRQGDAGSYVCGFTAFLLGWYQDEFSNPLDPRFVKSAGFIHLGNDLDFEQAEMALEATLGALTQHLDESTQ